MQQNAKILCKMTAKFIETKRFSDLITCARNLWIISDPRKSGRTTRQKAVAVSEYPTRYALRVAAVILCALVATSSCAQAAPYAALVMDARSGKVLHSRNADRQLHPASLTKMMTLYVAFEAIERGEISVNTEVRVSKHASKEPPSKLGLRAGQRIKLKYLIRAAAVKSANDAATAIGEAISGSEAAFARRMTATAKAMGMTRTRFRNAHGLTQNGHYSTARDMAILGRRLFYDHRDYYNLFSRIRTSAGKKDRVEHKRAVSVGLPWCGWHQDRIYARGGIQSRRLGPARERAHHRIPVRREECRVADRAHDAVA